VIIPVETLEHDLSTQTTLGLALEKALQVQGIGFIQFGEVFFFESRLLWHETHDATLPRHLKY
jgi:hypothetical protein